MNKLFKIRLGTAMLAVLFAIGFTTHSFGQSIANYTFATNTNGSLALDMNGNAIDMTTGTTTLIGASSLSGAGSGLTALPFDFWVMGTRNTQYSVSSNGWLGIGVALTGSGNGWLGGGTAGSPRVAPLLVNASAAATNNFAMGTSTTGKIHSKVIGSAPNRVLVIQYENMTINATLGTGTTNDATFQARLYETTGIIEFVYGAIQVSGTTAVFNAIGFSNTTTVYQSVDQTTHTASTSISSTPLMAVGTYTALSSSSNGSRRFYRFTPSQLTAPSGLNFTSVTASGMTLNWTDNSTGETGFIIQRSSDGGSTYQNVLTTAANAVSAALTGLVPSTSYLWRVSAVREILSAAATGTQATTAVNEVTSVASGNWSNPATWSSAAVPTASDNVTIANGHTVTIDSAGRVCNNLTVGQGVSGELTYTATPLAGLNVSGNVTIAAGATFNAGSGSLLTHTLAIGNSASASFAGNLTNNGTFDMNTTAGVTTTFFGNLDGAISGSGATCDFYAIVVNKGTSQTAVLDVTRVITMNAPTASANRLTITAGTFKMSSASSITPYFGSQTICTANGRLWLNNASATITVVGVGTTTGAGAPTVTGELRIDDGTFGYGSGNNTMTFSSITGVLRMSGGTLNVFGSVSFTSNVGTQMIMSGGNINVDPQAGNNSASTSFTIGASTTVDWSGGTITIIDPLTAGGISWTATSGGTKSVTGGTLRLGDGVSTSTGGVTANTSGFGFFSSMPVFNVEIKSSLSVNSRQTRLNSSTTSVISNSLTVDNGAYLFLGSSTTASTLNLQGTIANNGTIAGVEAGGTAQLIGTLQFSGSAAQTISGSGSFANLSTLTISNTAGVSSSMTFKVRRINLFSGSLNPANITIGNVSASITAGDNPVVQIGGVSTSTAAGSFTSLPTYDNTDGPVSLLYSTMDGAVTMGSYNEIGTGSSTITQLLLNDADGMTIPANRTITISGTLTMTLGNIALSGNALTLGTSASTAGTMSYTAGLIQGGAFTRWYPITGLPTTAGTAIGYYPIGHNNNNRQVQIFFSTATALSTGGTITVNHNNVSGTTAITGFVDGAITVDRRTNSNWGISTGDGIAASGTMSMAIRGENIVAVSAIADLRMIRVSDAVGTSANGTGTSLAPVVNRTSVSLTDLASTFYLGSSNSNLGSILTATTTGNWGDNATWDAGTTPTSNDLTFINSGITVTVAGTATPYQCLALTVNGTLTANANTLTIGGASTVGLTINSGGTVNVGGGTIVLGPANGGDRRLTLNGTLAITSGTVEVNGNVAIGAGSTFNQSGGDLKIDGNANNVVASSVASGTHLFETSSSTPIPSINCSAGAITIVDPPINSSTTSWAVSLGLNTGNNSTWFNGTHTFVFGDGVSTTTGEAATGFVIDGFSSNGRVALNRVTVNSGSDAGRFVRNTTATGNGTYIFGTLTINSGSEFRFITAATGNNAIGGNLVNNGTFTVATSTLSFGAPGGATAFLPTAAQTISGSGTFRNAISAPTAQTTGFSVINNSVTFDVGLTVSSAITVNNGATMTINAGRIINVTSGGVTNSGTIIAKSASSSSYAQLMTASTVTGGTIRFERTVGGTTAGWRMISSPVNANFNSFGPSPVFVGAANILTLNTASPNAWDSVSSVGTTTVGTGRGYLVYLGTGGVNNNSSSHTFNLSGTTLNTANVSVAGLSNGDGTVNFGWSVVGNPFGANLTWDTTTNTRTNIDNAYYIWNATSGGGTGAYASFVSGVSNPGGVLTNYIPPMQGFLVKANAASPVLTLAATSRNTGMNNAQLRTSTLFDVLRLRVAESSGNRWDEATFVSRTGATNAFESAYDAFKLMNFDATAPNLFSKATTGEILSINAFAEITGPVSIPVHFVAGANGNYSITLDAAQLGNQHTVTLEDLKTGVRHDMRTGAYNFAHLQSNTNDRFVLHLNASTVSVNNPSENPIHVYTYNNHLYVTGLAAGELVKSLRVLDITGKVVVNETALHADEVRERPLQLPTGTYMVQVVTDLGIKNVKVILGM